MTFIYALTCPITGATCYIGKSDRPKARLQSHVSDARKSRTDHVAARWIRELLSKGLEPQLKVLFRVPPDVAWQAAEKDCIAQHLAVGCQLHNSTVGGEGLKLLRQEDRDALSTSLRNAWSRPDVRESRLEKMRATFATSESKARRVAAAMNPETRAKKSASSKATFSSPEMKARLSAAQKANWSTPEMKAIKSAAVKAAWSDPVKRAARVAALRAAAAALRADPERSAKKAAAVKSSLATPESKSRLAAAMAEVRSRPEVNAKRAETMKAAWSHEPNREKWLQSFNTADARSAQSISQKQAWEKRKAAA